MGQGRVVGLGLSTVKDQPPGFYLIFVQLKAKLQKVPADKRHILGAQDSLSFNCPRQPCKNKSPDTNNLKAGRSKGANTN